MNHYFVGRCGGGTKLYRVVRYTSKNAVVQSFTKSKAVWSKEQYWKVATLPNWVVEPLDHPEAKRRYPRAF
jgi:hypothetical protein